MTATQTHVHAGPVLDDDGNDHQYDECGDGSWRVTTFPSRERPSRTKIIAVRGAGTARQVINVELTPDAAATFCPNHYWTRKPITQGATS